MYSTSLRPLGIEVRVGLHTGEVELRGDDIGGIAVHIGQGFKERGEHELKVVLGKWGIYAVRD